MKNVTDLDLLVFAVHPDDAELNCGGTIAKLCTAGKKVGIIDLTGGELGTRGSKELRLEEAAKSASILGLSIRENLGMRDGFFQNDEVHQLQIVEVIRRYRPRLVIANAPEDRHPDHGRASDLVRDAVFLSGLRKVETNLPAWRPEKLFYYIQDRHLKPDFVIDIGDWVEVKRRAIGAFESQFYNPESDEPETHISSSDFWDFVEARNRIMGHMIGVSHGEGFVSDNPLKVWDPLSLL